MISETFIEIILLTAVTLPKKSKKQFPFFLKLVVVRGRLVFYWLLSFNSQKNGSRRKYFSCFLSWLYGYFDGEGQTHAASNGVVLCVMDGQPYTLHLRALHTHIDIYSVRTRGLIAGGGDARHTQTHTQKKEIGKKKRGRSYSRREKKWKRRGRERERERERQREEESGK